MAVWQWQLIRQVKQNIQIDWDNLQASKRVAGVVDETAASRKRLRQAVQRYGAGLAINLDVLNAAYPIAQLAARPGQESFGYKVFYLDLLRDTGKLPLPAGLNHVLPNQNGPTTEELQPVALRRDKLECRAAWVCRLPPPATQPSSQPVEIQPSPATYPAIDFSLQPDVGFDDAADHVSDKLPVDRAHHGTRQENLPVAVAQGRCTNKMISSSSSESDKRFCLGPDEECFSRDRGALP